MERRIYGLENEYGVTCTLRGQRRLSPDEVARYLFRRVVSWGRSSNVFLQNGARLYLDVGSHPEYATPECDSLYELIVRVAVVALQRRVAGDMAVLATRMLEHAAHDLERTQCVVGGRWRLRKRRTAAGRSGHQGSQKQA